MALQLRVYLRVTFQHEAVVFDLDELKLEDKNVTGLDELAAIAIAICKV
eukprot:CAMPEP_0115087902 /NCGR_PEP_ID=MMETSP0227-20121206/23636_1 /TAXON_ID=89957 /ORGANISM="Polarella glacialis, Strain CCMP 1383" /LENGTH=48 /DNA_ID= /DNA_START= /DNA_END= /DNA_ORIENTATION=